MALFASKQTYFELLHLAGEGLNSCVYKALRRDITGTISQVVALKILKSKDNVSFWRQEVQSLLQVNSQYCVKVYDFEWIDNQPTMVLEWFEGMTLTRFFESTEISRELSLEILLQIQEGLVDLHLSHLCHGDLHMDNVFITNEGQIKLLDFGMANMSRFKFQGNPEMRAPELDCDGVPSLWSDLFALGMIAKRLGLEFPNLLAALPEDRDFISGKQDPNQRIRLANKVKDHLKKRKALHNQQTFVTPVYRNNSRFRWVALFSILFFVTSFVPRASSIISNLPSCLIEVRTLEWQKVQVNEGEARYSPADFLIHSCGSIKVSWKNSRGIGSFHIFLKNGEVLRLKDKDFKASGTN